MIKKTGATHTHNKHFCTQFIQWWDKESK